MVKHYLTVHQALALLRADQSIQLLAQGAFAAVRLLRHVATDDPHTWRVNSEPCVIGGEECTVDSEEAKRLLTVDSWAFANVGSSKSTLLSVIPSKEFRYLQLGDILRDHTGEQRRVVKKGASTLLTVAHPSSEAKSLADISEQEFDANPWPFLNSSTDFSFSAADLEALRELQIKKPEKEGE